MGWYDIDTPTASVSVLEYAHDNRCTGSHCGMHLTPVCGSVSVLSVGVKPELEGQEAKTEGGTG